MRDRVIVWGMICLQAIFAAVLLHAYFSCSIAIVFVTYFTWLKRLPPWTQRFVAISQFHRRLAVGIFLVGMAILRFLLGFYNAEQSPVGMLAELFVPAIVAAQSLLFGLLLMHEQEDPKASRKADAQLQLPLLCANVILLMLHYQYRGNKEILLVVSIALVGCVALLSDLLIKGRWLSIKGPVAVKSADRTGTSVSLNRAHKSSRPTLLLFAAFVTLTWSVSVNLDYFLPGVQGWMDDRFYSPGGSLASERFGMAYRYVEDANLDSVRSQIFEAPQRVAFRAYCVVPPGYMRGRAFEVYQNGRWRNASVESSTLAGRGLLPVSRSVAVAEDGTELNRFRIASGGRGRSIAVEIRNDPVRGNFYFCPLTTELIEGRGGRLRLDRNDIPRAGLSVQHPYRSVVFENPGDIELSAEQLELYLGDREKLAPMIRDLADNLCGDYPNASSKAAAVQRYLRSQHKYSLEPFKTPGGVDPIVHFLETKRAAHCEYFASAAALMLRSVDVPCRYVTGYVVDELADSEDYWLARNRNAHAWVEAYDADRKAWFVVEATPGQDVVQLQFDGNDGRDRRLTNTGNGNSLGRTGWLRILDALTSTAFQYKLQSWLTQLRLPLAAVVLGLLVFRFSAPYRRRYGADTESQKHQKTLRSYDRRAAKLGLRRKKGETLHQFAARIEDRLSETQPVERDKFADLSQQYVNYAIARYSGSIGSGSC